MKKYIALIISMLFLTACGGTSNNFVNVSMPNFKPPTPTKIEPLDSTISIALEPINLEQNNNHSDYFQNSVLKIRIEKEIELLKQNLEEQIKVIAQLKGYKIVNSNPDYILKTFISIDTEEKNVQKTSSFMGGDSIKSNLSINFKGKIDFIDAHNTQNSTQLSNNTKLDSFIMLDYPIKGDDGINMFKTTISTVPTQLNKGLEKPAFEIDKSFLAFYKNTLNTLYNNLPKAANIDKTSHTTHLNEFNSFDNNSTLEDDFSHTQSHDDSNDFENTTSKRTRLRNF
ncbi:hypothetical protein LNU06_01535 [Campylobacter sp. VicNov18]|uniref:hypothetical protein n=1 Tax=Campylobacter bilis TaxID=2691918 RepID=UPI00130DCC25|nr:hypothetical protein [Campylobacter bilis]MPV63349.1 hypothetical protein [Campylobacter hepaticus]MBM0636848.1 hypothetical protein [Campylobacter bilis]MCC8277419.1 hypothetical protein [Campylobacter bilis]MCC8299162.1 hypothetical protein [Campylobacter bilis]MCC8300328.1 hypothetical protein [Campylobacter bilis]